MTPGERAANLERVTAGEPASVGAGLAALRILQAETERRARVRENGDLLRRLLTEAGAPPLPGSGAVVAVPTGGEDVTAAAWRAAYDAAVYCNAVAHPAVPRGKGVLRLSVMATHTAEHLRTAAEIVARAVVRATAEPQRAVA